MLGCWRVRGLIAASLYEPLEAGEQARLDRHIARCAGCRERLEGFGRIAGLPSGPVVFGGDLLPVLRQRIAEERVSVRSPWRWAAPLSACALVLLAVAGAGVWTASQPQGESQHVLSGMESMMAKAETLSADHDYQGAGRALQDALAAYPKDPRAGEAELRLADLQFAELQRYPDAYESYQAVRSHYPETWKASSAVVKDRFDLLSEARVKQFEPLYAFDAARNAAGDSLHELERVVARYPGSMIASMAVLAMRENVAGPETNSGPMKAAALESVRDCLSDPIAVAQVNVALGDMYWRELHDSGRAREVYSKAAESGHAGLAMTARLALAELGQE